MLMFSTFLPLFTAALPPARAAVRLVSVFGRGSECLVPGSFSGTNFVFRISEIGFRS